MFNQPPYIRRINTSGILVITNTDSVPEGASNLYFTNERVDDRVNALIQNGTGISWTYNDVANTLTANVSITQYTDEMAQDAVFSIIAEGFGVKPTYDDAGGSAKFDAFVKTIIGANLTVPAGYQYNMAEECEIADGIVLEVADTGALNIL